MSSIHRSHTRITHGQLPITLFFTVLVTAEIFGCDKPQKPGELHAQRSGIETPAWVEGNCVHLSYSQVLVSHKDQILEVPIFRGSLGSRSADQIRHQLSEPFLSIVGNLCFDVSRAGVRNTLMELLDFYKDSLLVDVSPYIPQKIEHEGRNWIFTFDIKMANRPATFQIVVPMDHSVPILKEGFELQSIKDVRMLGYLKTVKTVESQAKIRLSVYLKEWEHVGRN